MGNLPRADLFSSAAWDGKCDRLEWYQECWNMNPRNYRVKFCKKYRPVSRYALPKGPTSDAATSYTDLVAECASMLPSLMRRMKVAAMLGQVELLLSHPDDLKFIEGLKTKSTKEMFDALQGIVHGLVERNNREVDGYGNSKYDWDSFNKMSDEDKVNEMERLVGVLNDNHRKQLQSQLDAMDW